MPLKQKYLGVGMYGDEFLKRTTRQGGVIELTYRRCRSDAREVPGVGEHVARKGRSEVVVGKYLKRR